jgi:hypothetical protein
MAYTFKQLAPNTCYVIMDLPQAFLFSAVYLMSALPDAKFAFHGDGPIEDLVALADFVFMPNWALPALELPRLDLTINMVSFQEMTDAQVNAYVEKAWGLGSSYLYSYNRDASLYNDEITSVAKLLQRHFWLHEIPIDPDDPAPEAPLPVARGVEEMRAEKRRRVEERERRAKEKDQRLKEKQRSGYRHIIGWPRDREPADQEPL